MSLSRALHASRDDLAFPIRFRVRFPADGSVYDLQELLTWLRLIVTPADGACHAAPTQDGTEMIALIYLRNFADADAFMRTFPRLELANSCPTPVLGAAESRCASF